MSPAVMPAPEVLHVLDRLDFAVWDPAQGRPGGPHPSTALGLGTRFEDFRHYAPGDDLRYLDWNALGRLGEPFIKRFSREEAGRLSLLVDRTASMTAGAADGASAARTARGAAAVLAYVGLKSGCEVEVLPVPPGRAGLGGYRGRGAAAELFARVGRLDFGQPAPLYEALKAAVAGRDLGAATFLITDLADPEAGRRVLRLLRARRSSSALIQVVHRPEAFAALGYREIRDPESGRAVRVRVTPALRRRYLARLERFHEQLRHRCRTLGVRHVRLGEGQAPDLNMVRALQAGGLLH